MYEAVSILSFGLGFLGIVVGLALSMDEEKHLNLSRTIVILGAVAMAVGVTCSILYA